MLPHRSYGAHDFGLGLSDRGPGEAEGFRVAGFLAGFLKGGGFK